MIHPHYSGPYHTELVGGLACLVYKKKAVEGSYLAIYRDLGAGAFGFAEVGKPLKLCSTVSIILLNIMRNY